MFLLSSASLILCATLFFGVLIALATRLHSGEQRIVHNKDWTPIIETFDGVAMVYVPPGCFQMGVDDQLSVKIPQHPQCIERGFWLERHEVTNAQYRACVEVGVCTSPSLGPQGAIGYLDPAYADYPVSGIDWYQAWKYADWRGGRLPTEVEWEYAARGPDSLEYPWGDRLVEAVVNYCDVQCTGGWRTAITEDGYTYTSPVGSFPAGASWVGALDMSGNIWEWTSTRFGVYPYTTEDGRERVDQPDVSRVLRGGSWLGNEVMARSAYREGRPAYYINPDIGLRVAFDRPQED